jgi:HK97 family phage major capsid protein
VELSQQLEGLTDQQGTILKLMEEQNAVLALQGEGFDEAKAKLGELGQQMAEITEERAKVGREAEIVRQGEIIDELRDATRSPSRAKSVANGTAPKSKSAEDLFFWSLWATKTARGSEFAAEGKALLDQMDTHWADIPAYSKATLGDTAAAGGNVIPPNVLEGVIEIATAINIYRNLLTVVDAGFVAGINVPTEGLAPVRATVQAYGATKTNIDLTVALYTATMYTLAAIYDVGNQLLRNSRGAAEKLVRDRLSRAMALGESYYILQGSGTSEPKGILTSIGTSGTFVSSFTPSATTLAGSIATAVTVATGALANRSRMPDGVVVNAGDFWTMASQGTDTAGFFLSPAGGPSAINPTIGMMRLWGLPVYADVNMPTDNLVVGEWRGATLYTGQTYRVDVSDQAGTRWDKNETGFRGEEEIGFNADPYVVAGLFQRITDLHA